MTQASGEFVGVIVGGHFDGQVVWAHTPDINVPEPSKTSLALRTYLFEPRSGGGVGRWVERHSSGG